MLVAVLGGLLGILMMIPLRRALIVEQHGILKYPEGTACAEVLKAGATRRVARRGVAGGQARAERRRRRRTQRATTIFAGFGLGLLYKALNVAFKRWKDTPEKIFGAPFAGGLDRRRDLARAARRRLHHRPAHRLDHVRRRRAGLPGADPGDQVLRRRLTGAARARHDPDQPDGARTRSAAPTSSTSAPARWRPAASSACSARCRRSGSGLQGRPRRLQRQRRRAAAAVAVAHRPRPVDEVVVLGGIVALIAVDHAAPSSLHMNLVGALLIVVFGFLFVTVSSRLTGEIGSSSNPISGMTVATLLLTCLIFLVARLDRADLLRDRALGRRHRLHRGLERRHHLAGPEDRLPGRRDAAHQQIAILVGALASALVLGPDPADAERRRHRLRAARRAGAGDAPGLRDVGLRRRLPQTRRTLDGPAGGERRGHLPRLAQDRRRRAARPASYLVRRPTAAPVYLVDPGINGIAQDAPGRHRRSTKFDAPKATLMSYIIKGILNRQLPWGLVLLGVMIAVVLEMSGIPSLAFAVGVYLPLSSSSPIFIGGVVRWLVDLQPAQEARGPQPDRGGADRRRRQEPRRADGVGLHRRRRHRRHRHRLHRPACSPTSTRR